MSEHIRNVNGVSVPLSFQYLDPELVQLDPCNPRIWFTLSQLPEDERNQQAIELLLHTQENLEELKRSIKETKGVQEPIYVRHNMIVAEGSRRVASLRELKSENPGDSAFQAIPAWVIPDGIGEDVVQELINSAHLDPKRQWAPFERALVLRGLYQSGKTAESLAATYEMDAGGVREFISAAERMLATFVPLWDDPQDPEIKEKFSYFLEYEKGPRSAHLPSYPDLDDRFANWVKDGVIPKAERVRKLGKVLASPTAVQALDEGGWDAAMEVLMVEDVSENRSYKTLTHAVRLLSKMPPEELIDLRSNPDRQAVIKELARNLQYVMLLAGISE